MDDRTRFEQAALARGGFTVSCVQQANGPYWSVAGGGVRAGGYKTFDEAWSAWVEGLDYLDSRQGTFLLSETRLRMRCGIGRKVTGRVEK